MSLVPATVVRRYLAKKAAFSFRADERFRPPASIVNAVDSGKLPAEVLSLWEYCAETLLSKGRHFEYGACIKHWRNKCGTMGIDLPKEYLDALGGEGSEGAFKVKTGEQIEDWVKECLKSKGLIVEVGRSSFQWKTWADHWKNEIKGVQVRIDTHVAALASGQVGGKTLREKGIAQRQKWLEDARSELDGYAKELSACDAAIEELQAAMSRYDEHKSPTIEFEKEFQFMLLLAAKDFDKKTIMQAVGKAIKRFNEGLDIPMATPADDPSKYQGYKAAGVLDFLSDALKSAWKFMQGVWAQFTDWLSDLKGDTAKINKLLTKAGAPA